MIPNIKWYLGQALIPEHFEMQQNSIIEQIYAFCNSHGIPNYGLNIFDIDKTFMKIGIFKISKFKYYEIDGKIIEMSVNAQTKDLDINNLHQNSSDVFVNIYEEEFKDDYKKQQVKCHGYQIVPSFVKDLRAKYSHKIIQLEKELNKTWYISTEYIPSLNNMSISLVEPLLCKLSELSNKIIIDYENMTKDKDFIAKSVDFREVCICAYNLKVLLDNVNIGIDVHPYTIYKKLCSIYFRIALFFNIKPTIPKTYSHDESFLNITNIKNMIDELLSSESKTASYVKFESNEIIYATPELSDSVVYAKNIFFVVQKSTQGQVYNPDNLRLISSSRHSITEKLALPGINKIKLKKIPFRHYLSDNCDFYKINFGKEWDYVVKDKTIEFKKKSEYKNLKFYIYYF